MRISFVKVLLVGLALVFSATPILASHFRGGNVNAQVSEDGIVTLTYQMLWRKGTAFFPFDGVSSLRLYNPADVSRNSPLRFISVNIGNTTVFRDVSDPAFDFRVQVVRLDLQALGLAQGRYVARWENCCRIRGIQNAPESSFSLEALIIFNGSANGSPVLNSRILTVVGKGLPYSQNLNAFDPEARPLTYQWLIGSGRPTFGPTFNVPGITLDATGQIDISAFDTARLVDFNPFNPAGDYVFKVRVTDADGAFSERDVLLDVVATANQPPEITPIGNRVIQVGESLVLPITASDPNVIDTVRLSTSALPSNTVLVTTPGNPATGTLAFRPDASQVGVFGINVEAKDNGSPILTDSELVTITVLDPANTCPVLAAIGNRDLSPGEPLSFTLSGADPDGGQTLTFSASFLPSGASFDPVTATFNWTPSAADAGVHLGTVFEVRDSSSPPCSDVEVVGFTVQPSNRFPVLAPIGGRTVTEGTMVFFTVAGSDPDGDAVAFDAAPLPIGASFDPDTRQFMWTPTIGQAGTYEIVFRVTDTGDPVLSDRETVRIIVAADGAEPIRLLGVSELQSVSGQILVEAQVVAAFPTTGVTFAIDGQEINTDATAPYFLGGEVDGLPAGFDTFTLDDGLHVISATAVDGAGQSNTTQRKIVVSNFVPPTIEDVDGLFDGAVVDGTLFVEVDARDDQEVSTVEFRIDGVTVSTETGAPYFMGGSFLPEGTFDVSCTVCLQAGDRNGDLVVVDVADDGTLDELCGAANLILPLSKMGTPDGETPSEEDVCDSLRGRGPAFGLCNAFCEAQDCDGPGYRQSPCEQLRDNFVRLTEEVRFPCEAGGDCISSLTLGWVGDPSLFATFGPEDFNGAETRFQLPIAIPFGFDTTTLSNGEHTLTVVVTDNLGLVTTVELTFTVDNAPPPPDALKVSFVTPVDGESFEEGRVVPVAAALADVQGAAVVRFYADGDFVAADADVPYETAVLVPEGAATLRLEAVAVDDRGPRAAAPVRLVVVPRPAEPEPIALLAVVPDSTLDGRVAVDSALRLFFSRPVDAASLGGIVLSQASQEVTLDFTLEADGAVVLATPFQPMTPDALHTLVVDGVAAPDGARVPRHTSGFVTFPDAAIVVGSVLDSDFRPLAGMEVAVGEVTGTTDESGAFRLEGVPTGEQLLEIHGGEIDGLTYPPLDFPITVEAGVRFNGLAQPVMLVPLDLAGGLDVVDGIAAGGGILTSSELPGMSLDLNGVSVLNPDGTPFTGRMSITPVPAHAVPMELPAGFGSDLYITVQPGHLRLAPPAPIVYPNQQVGALPGEQVPLIHFDHDVNDWVVYGTGTATADSLFVVSDPGVGLPGTGWGAPLPPPTFTTVRGRVVDIEDNPLHGVMVGAGNRRGVSEQDGTFEIRDVFAGRQGSPVNITVLAIARDIFIQVFSGSTPFPVRAVQNGTTFVGDVEIRNYAPAVNGKIHPHGDYRPTVGQDHVLKPNNSTHQNERRYQREVEELQKRLREMGFREGGSLDDHGQQVQVTGFYSAETRHAVKLFQALELNNGGSGIIDCTVCDGLAGKDTIGELNDNIPAGTLLWGQLRGFTDWNPGDEPADAYGTIDMESFLGDVGGLTVNDVSLPAGGEHPDHSWHETGIDVDVMLPVAAGTGPAHTPNAGGTIRFGYDQAAVEQILRDAIDTSATVHRFFDDNTVCLMTHNGVNLCHCTQATRCASGHHDHIHFQIDPSQVSGGVNLKAAELPSLLSVTTPGSSEADVAVDGTLVAALSLPLDPSTLNATTVLLEGPFGAVAGNVFADPSGLLVRFEPVADLDFGSQYVLTITNGAVLADGSLLAVPFSRSFTTEPTPSLRVLKVDPAFSTAQVPLDSAIRVRFDDPVDPTTLSRDAVALLDDRTGERQQVDLSLVEEQTLLIIRPREPFEPVQPTTLALTSDIRAVDGSPLLAGSIVTSFTTSLPPGIRRIDFAPAEVTFSRADLAPIALQIAGVFEDGSTLDLGSTRQGTLYSADTPGIVDVDSEGVVRPTGDGEAIITVIPYLPGFRALVRARVVDVFPEITFVGRQFSLAQDDDVVLRFSEPLDGFRLAVDNVAAFDADGQPISGLVSISGDGLLLTFDPDFLLPLRTDFTLRFDLLITDDLGVTRPFVRRVPFSTLAANLGFELGNLTGFEAEGDVEVVQSFGPLTAPEGDFMATLTTSDAAVDGARSKLRALDVEIPPGAVRMALIYNFLTDEIEQGQPFNDFFTVNLEFSDGTSQTLLTVTRDQLRFSGSVSPVPGFDRMTGFRSASVPLARTADQSSHLIFEVLINDAGDASIDSAVLIDDIHFE